LDYPAVWINLKFDFSAKQYPKVCPPVPAVRTLSVAQFVRRTVERVMTGDNFLPDKFIARHNFPVLIQPNADKFLGRKL
jgi:hypothetical protein